MANTTYISIFLPTRLSPSPASPLRYLNTWGNLLRGSVCCTSTLFSMGILLGRKLGIFGNLATLRTVYRPTDGLLRHRSIRLPLRGITYMGKYTLGLHLDRPIISLLAFRHCRCTSTCTETLHLGRERNSLVLLGARTLRSMDILGDNNSLQLIPLPLGRILQLTCRVVPFLPANTVYTTIFLLTRPFLNLPPLATPESPKLPPPLLATPLPPCPPSGGAL